MKFVALLRPHQWVKNAFVLVGLLFSQRWTEGALIVDVVTTLVAFCLLSSAVYVFNDVFDRHLDRQHPLKRARPVAAGRVSVRLALVLAGLLGLGAVVLLVRVSHEALAIGLSYAALNVVYTLGGKNVPVYDVFSIAGGFMLRLLAGTAGVGIAPSNWLLICGLMLTLFLGFTKRRAELASLRGLSSEVRPVLAGYSLELLDTMIAACAAGLVLSYGLYTVSPETVALHGTGGLIWTTPFVLYGVFRYLFLVHQQGAGLDTARDLARDWQLLVACLGWLGTTLVLIR